MVKKPRRKSGDITVAEPVAESLLPPASLGPGLVQMRLQIEPKVNAPKYYANHAEINLTPFEMVMTFARLPARFDADEAERLGKGEVIVIPAEVQISVPIQMIPGLIKVMTHLKSEHDRTIGNVPYPPNESVTNE